MKEKLPWYITTAIPYVNARPHLGFAQEIVITDALARFQRQRGQDVRFLTGTDENSLKNVRAAVEEGISTQALVDRNADNFQQLRQALNLSFDDFIRTSADPHHRTGVVKLWRASEEKGDIYKRPYSGLYCVGCEHFYDEDELVDGLCPEHRLPPEWVEEENYFFRLTRYEKGLLSLIESGQLCIEPAWRRNEVISFIRRGLRDFSISRTKKRAHGWGIPVPGDPSQVMYVWYDALGNYITALDYANNGPLFQRYWLQNPNRVHVIGKGITRFHAIYWPAMLLSAGVPLPTTIFAHGYVTVNGEKISKSLGNTVDPVTLAATYGIDSLRYYLLRHIHSTTDGDFTLSRFVDAHNGDLADRLGNLLNRTVRMVERYWDGRVPRPDPGTHEGVERRLLETAVSLPARLNQAMSQFLTHEALAAIWELVAEANRYVEVTKPWVLAKQRKQGDASAEGRLGTVLYNLVEGLRLVAYFCQPFLPETAAAMAQQLNVSLAGEWQEAVQWGGYPAGTAMKPAAILFPKFTG